jgi:Protein of unknown function (DUF4230)
MMRAMTSEPSGPSWPGRLLRLGVLALFTYGAYRVGDNFGARRGYHDGLAQGLEQDREDRTLERTDGPAVAMSARADELVVPLTALTADAPPAEFTAAVDTIYRDLIGQTARVYPFSAGHDARAFDAWADRKDRVSEQMYRQLRAWQSERAPLPGTKLALTHHAAASDGMTVLRDQACGVVREVWSASTAPGDSRPVLPGLCAVVERELLAPFGAALVEAAIGLDVQNAVTSAETRYRKTIMELATAEMKIDAVVRNDYESKLFEGWMIESTDRATIEVKGSGIVKSGFQMDQQYAVAVLPDESRIRVTLPRAAILSNTLVPSFSMEKEGWWTSLTSAQRNQAIQALSQKVERQALQDGILKEAEDRAVGLVQDLYSPFTALPGSPYEVEVVFAGEPKPIE